MYEMCIKEGLITCIGILSIEPYQIYKEYSFMEYLHGGLEISLAIAIDFTGSNGNPKDSSSLHYFNTRKIYINDIYIYI